MMPSQGRLPGEKKPMKINNDIEMKEHKVSPVLLNHKAGAWLFDGEADLETDLQINT